VVLVENQDGYTSPSRQRDGRACPWGNAAENGVFAGHAEGEHRTEAEASTQAEGEERAGHDQPFTGDAGDAGEATGEPLTT